MGLFVDELVGMYLCGSGCRITSSESWLNLDPFMFQWYIYRFGVLILPFLRVYWDFPAQPCDAQPLDMEGMSSLHTNINRKTKHLNSLLNQTTSQNCRGLATQISTSQMLWLMLASRLVFLFLKNIICTQYHNHYNDFSRFTCWNIIFIIACSEAFPHYCILKWGLGPNMKKSDESSHYTREEKKKDSDLDWGKNMALFYSNAYADEL